MGNAKIIFILLASTLFALAVIGGIFLAEGALHPQRRPLLAVDQQQASDLAYSNASYLSDVSIPASDGVVLRAWHFQPRKNFKSVVILSHGLSDNRAGMLGYAQFLLRYGYDVLIRTRAPTV